MDRGRRDRGGRDRGREEGREKGIGRGKRNLEEFHSFI